MVDLKLIKPQDLWYIVGYIAADGCLSKDGRHIDITSKDRQILKNIIQALHLNIKIRRKYNSSGLPYSCIQFSHSRLYRFLLEINLTPRKSLTLGKLKVRKNYFKDFFRGVIDGDGSITSWIHPSNYRLQWSLRIVSASKDFVDWLKQTSEPYFGVAGKVYIYPPRRGRHHLYLLKFGKIAAKIIINKCYYRGCLSLRRKYQQAIRCLQSDNGWDRYRFMTSPGAETGRQSRLKI